MESSIRTLLDLLGRPEFHTGILTGAGAWLATHLLSSTRRGWGIALSAATIAGVNIIVTQRMSTALGLVILGVGGALAARSPTAGPVAWLTIAAGAVITSLRGGLPDTLWVQLAVPVLIIGSGHLLSSWSELPQRHLLGPLVFITAFGIWVTVPDTDAARVLLGASAVLGLATLGDRGLRISSAGAYPLAGTLIWIAASGGEGRHGSIVGAWACAGMLLILPLLVDRARALPDLLVVGTHVLLVVLSSRLLGRLDAAAPVVVGVVVLGVVTYLLLRAYVVSEHPEVDSH